MNDHVVLFPILSLYSMEQQVMNGFSTNSNLIGLAELIYHNKGKNNLVV
jgi:hypothetical protein